MDEKIREFLEANKGYRLNPKQQSHLLYLIKEAEKREKTHGN